jgi:3-phosphoshikimate 1-carboxyvinyltransferase
MIGSIAARGAEIESPLRGEDCEHTLNIIRQLGAEVSSSGNHVKISPSRLTSPDCELYCGNSGTTMRLMAGLLAGAGVNATLTGDESLGRRPMRRITEPLRLMGADIDASESGAPPITLRSAPLHGISYASPVASAQVKSAVLLAGLFADGQTSVTEPALSRDHTEKMLAGAGCKVARNELTVTVEPGLPDSIEMQIPADISSAAFFLVAAALLGGPVTLKGVGVNPTRTGILDVLKQAGAELSIAMLKDEGGEPVADVSCERPTSLRPFRIDPGQVPTLIDEIPVACVLATQCEGTSVIRGAGELRVKESDRIDAIAKGLTSMGADVQPFEDGLAINGPTTLRSAHIDAMNDHRIAMAFAIAGLLAEGETTIHGSETIATSFPDFESELRRLAGA